LLLLLLLPLLLPLLLLLPCHLHAEPMVLGETAPSGMMRILVCTSEYLIISMTSLMYFTAVATS
jgi:hypothetical protein